MNKNLPEILLWQNYGPPIIGALNLKETSKGEWHGPCPECGGTDRFWINEFKGELYTHCRQCHDYPAIKDKLRDAGLLPRRQPETGENQASTQPQPTSLSEPYHIRKQIDLNLGECSLSGDKLIVQINDIITGEKRGTQTIANSSKLFSKGLVKEGAGTFIGPRTATLLVCEGLADAQALHTTTGHQALFSLDASTIPKNVKLLRENDPSRDIIVCADNDAKGLEAAKKSGVQFSLPSQSGEDWHDVFSRLGVEATKAEFEKNLKKPRLLDSELQAFNIISAEELAQKKFDPIEFLVPELLPAVGLTMLSGAPKVGKSYFCLKLISQFQSSCDVLYLANEDNERRLQQRNSQIFQFGPPPNLLLIPGLSSETPLPRGEAALRFIRQIKQKYPNVGCVFVDTVAGIRERSGREKNYDTTEAEFSALRKLSHELEIAVVAVHHNRKRTESDASPLEQILGSQGIAATVETALILQQAPGTQDVDLFVTGKDIEQREIRYKWNNPGFVEAGDVVEASLGPFQRDCLNFIRQHPRCMQTAIVTATKHAKSTVSEAIKKLGERGLVMKDDAGRLRATAKDTSALY
jgi:phage/plasmid primase-like uncharacterized protein